MCVRTFPHPPILDLSTPRTNTNTISNRPNFTVTLLRTPFLPPTFATFIVPLNLTKIDIRDYIYHAYGVKAIKVRSYVQQQKIRPNKPNFKNQHARKWFRPRSIKKMTIEMDKPFVWPDEPEDFSP